MFTDRAHAPLEHPPSRRRGLRRGLALLGFVAVIAACGPTVAPAPSGPAFPGWPALAAGPGASPCLTVLLIGDSLMKQSAPSLPSALADHGRCATVINAAVNGTGPGRDWPDQLPALLQQYQPQVVVAEFIGNTPQWPDAPFDSPLYNQRQQDGSTRMIAEAQAAGAHVYWSIAPATCVLGDPESQGWADYQAWAQTTDLGVVKPDWRHWITPTGQFSEYLTFTGGSVQAVRQPDCVHLVDLGGRIAATVVAAAIEGEWPSPVATTGAPGPRPKTVELDRPAAIPPGQGP